MGILTGLGYVGEHYATIIAHSHNPAIGGHLNQVVEDLDHH